MLVRVQNVDELYVGQKVRYKSKGYVVHDETGAHLTSADAEYDAKVVQITDNIVCLRLTADQSTIHRGCVWEAKPYNWSIRVWDLNHGFEHLSKEAYEI